MEAHIFFPSKGLLFFLPNQISNLLPGLLDHTMRTLFFCHGHMSIQARRKFKRFGGKGGGEVSRRSFIRKIFLLPSKNWRCVCGGGAIAPPALAPPVPTVLVSSEFNWNSTFICDRRRLVRTFEGQFSRSKVVQFHAF